VAGCYQFRHALYQQVIHDRVPVGRRGELLRLQGELQLLQAAGKGSVRNTSAETEAAISFRQALEIARHQQTKALELRAAISLSMLWQGQGQHAQAHQLVAAICGWFTESFDTADLQEATVLLAALA
jgi:predicted ATPase